MGRRSCTGGRNAAPSDMSGAKIHTLFKSKLCIFIQRHKLPLMLLNTILLTFFTQFSHKIKIYKYKFTNMDVYISYFKRSMNNEYLKRVKEIETLISQEYNMIKPNEVENKLEDREEQEYNRLYSRYNCYKKSSFLEKLNKPLYVICCLNSEYATNENCLDELEIADKNWNHRVIVCVEDENSETFYGIKECGLKGFTYSEKYPKLVLDYLMGKDLNEGKKDT